MLKDELNCQGGEQQDQGGRFAFNQGPKKDQKNKSACQTTHKRSCRNPCPKRKLEFLNKRPCGIGSNCEADRMGKMEKAGSYINETEADRSQQDCACADDGVDDQLQVKPSVMGRYWLTFAGLPAWIVKRSKPLPITSP